MCQETYKVFKIAQEIVPDVPLTVNVRNGYKTGVVEFRLVREDREQGMVPPSLTLELGSEG